MTIFPRNRRRSAAASAAVALVALATLATTAAPASASASIPTAAAVAATPSALALPRPTGPYATGRDALLLTDHARPDPWAPDAGPRRLSVTLHYPARPGTGGDPAPYLAVEEARLMLAQRGL
ncbi:alpha/beta hydrolase, partial [Streptomyces sp. SID10692]|nr:alpha/beta hydrolase [Streptomyces sp. SID10692]